MKNDTDVKKYPCDTTGLYIIKIWTLYKDGSEEGDENAL